MEDQRNSGSRYLLGLLLIIIGGLFFLQELNIAYFGVGHIVFSWPFFIFVIGLVIVINARHKTFGGILTFIGLLLLLPRIFPGIDIPAGIIVPVLIILLGLFIIFRKHPKQRGEFSGDKINLQDDTIDEVAVFGGGARIINSQSFKGGNITAIFGGSEIDFTNAKLAEGENVIDVALIFGGTTLIVPNDWNIVVNVTPIFGGFSNKSRRDPSKPIDATRTLVIKGATIFGGGEIKSSF